MKRTLLLAILLCLALPCAVSAADGGLDVAESVAKAVKQHPQIKSLLHNKDAVSKSKAAALGRFFPTLDLSSNYGFQQYNSRSARNVGTQDRTRTASDSTATLTQNVFDGLDRYNYYQGQDARLSSAEYRLFDTVETVALDAIRAHIDVVRERKLVALASDNIVAHQDVLVSIAERVAGGAGSKADEMQARGRVARAETTLVTYTGSLRTAEAQYIRTVGEQPGELIEPDFALDLIPEGMDPLMEISLADNPKILVYKKEVEIAERDKNVVRAAFMPTVDIEVSSRYTNNLDGSDNSLQDNRAMLAMSWNIFSSGTDYNDTRSAVARVKEAESNLQDSIDDMTRQVATAWADYQTSVGQIEKHAEALDYSIQSRDMYLMQFNVGQRSLLDVLDAINEVFSNSVLLETAKSNRTVALYKFLALEGHLVQSMNVPQEDYDTLPQ